jgi:hypothetical protein
MTSTGESQLVARSQSPRANSKSVRRTSPRKSDSDGSAASGEVQWPPKDVSSRRTTGPWTSDRAIARQMGQCEAVGQSGGSGSSGQGRSVGKARKKERVGRKLLDLDPDDSCCPTSGYTSPRPSRTSRDGSAIAAEGGGREDPSGVLHSVVFLRGGDEAMTRH